MIAALLLALVPQTAPNVLVVVWDDVGSDRVPQACTPRLDQLAAAGVSFENARANPLCAVTRAALLSGRYSCRTGVGTATMEEELLRSEVTLAEHLRAYGWRTWYAGKWHLARGSDPLAEAHPNDQGFDHYRGALHGTLAAPPGTGYWDWAYTVDGTTTMEDRYATTVTATDALELAVGSEPWFGMVGFNAAHSPFHVPPAEALPPGGPCSTGTTQLEMFLAMIESVDYATGVVVDGILAAYPNTYVMVLSDNGTPRGLATSCPRGHKSDTWDGGLLVPWVVYGPGIQGGVTRDDLIGPVDLFATVCELVGVPIAPKAVDSVSFVYSLFGGPAARSWAYSEKFRPSGLPFAPATEWQRAVVEQDWKLIRRSGTDPGGPLEELFHLSVDPCEFNNLLRRPNLTGAATAALNRMDAVLAGICP